MTIGWERISDPKIKEVSAPGREVRAGWGWGAKVLSVIVRGRERAQGGRDSSQMHAAWRASEWGWGRY